MDDVGCQTSAGACPPFGTYTMACVNPAGADIPEAAAGIAAVSSSGVYPAAGERGTTARRGT